jgi:hypothetical protein
MAHLTCAEALRTLLRHVDYLADPPASGSRVTVEAALPRDVILQCREALEAEGRLEQTLDEAIGPTLYRSGFR